MMHFTTPEFWECYGELPPNIRRLADKNYALLKSNPKHRSLRLKKVGQYWSARVGLEFRAVAIESDDDLVWFWIAPHEEYERLIK